MTVFSFTHKGRFYMGEVTKSVNDEGLKIFHATVDDFPEHVGISDIMTEAVDSVRESMDQIIADQSKPKIREEETTDV